MTYATPPQVHAQSHGGGGSYVLFRRVLVFGPDDSLHFGTEILDDDRADPYVVGKLQEGAWSGTFERSRRGFTATLGDGEVRLLGMHVQGGPLDGALAVELVRRSAGGISSLLFLPDEAATG